MKILAPSKSIAQDIKTIKRSSHTLAESSAYLQLHKDDMLRFESIEDLAIEAVDSSDPTLKGIYHHLSTISTEIDRFLGKNLIFIGGAVIESILFHNITNERSVDPILDTFTFIHQQGFTRPGIIVYPMHSLGLLGAGILRDIYKTEFVFSINENGMAIIPQTNSIEESRRRLAQACELLTIGQEVPTELVNHWIRSRPLKWFHRNPLLVLRIKSYPGSYYANQRSILGRLKFTSSLLFMLATLEEPERDTIYRVGSSSVINNFQTLNFKHYLNFFPRSKYSKYLTGYCIPMAVRKPELVETSDMPIEIDPRLWQRRGKSLAKIAKLMMELEEFYFKNVLNRDGTLVQITIGRKLFDSLHFFRRSFRNDGYPDEGIVSLTVAFEVMLVDNYSAGVGEMIKKNLALALRGTTSVRKLRSSFEGLYDARSEIVHSGRAQTAVDMAGARRAYVHALLKITKLLTNLPQSSSKPISDLLNNQK